MPSLCSKPAATGAVRIGKTAGPHSERNNGRSSRGIALAMGLKLMLTWSFAGISFLQSVTSCRPRAMQSKCFTEKPEDSVVKHFGGCGLLLETFGVSVIRNVFHRSDRLLPRLKRNPPQ